MQVTAEQMRVLADALEEFSERMSDSFVMEEFNVTLSTGSGPNALQITAALHPEDAQQFLLGFNG